MRRRLVLLTVAAALVAVMAPTVQAAPSAQGALKASFNAALSGGNGNWYATEFHDAQALFHAANNSIYQPFFGIDSAAARISPVGGDQRFCADKTFGIWVIVWDTDKAALRGLEFDIWFDGELLDSERSAAKRMVDPNGAWLGGEKTWWMSIGVPVYGTLEPGAYPMMATTPGFPPFEGTVHVEDC